MNALLPGCVPVGVVSSSATGSYMRAEVELRGTQKTRPSGRSTPPENAPLPGYVPDGVVVTSATVAVALVRAMLSSNCEYVSSPGSVQSGWTSVLPTVMYFTAAEPRNGFDDVLPILNGMSVESLSLDVKFSQRVPRASDHRFSPVPHARQPDSAAVAGLDRPCCDESITVDEARGRA